MDWTNVEGCRLALQTELDAQKTSADRNRLGQFATPTVLARDMLAFGLRQLGRGKPVRFLDPAIGTGSFYSALRHELRGRPTEWARGFEIDPHYARPSEVLWQGAPLELRLADFTEARPEGPGDLANLLIANPPYVRHHHIPASKKAALQIASERACGVRMAGLAGLYCHFMALSHQWMAGDGIAGWLVPSEFMDVNYGSALKRYLLSKVTLLRIHRFDPADVQFEDALVSSAVVWFRNASPPLDQEVEFSFGGSLAEPKLIRSVPLAKLDAGTKWTRYPRLADAADANALRVGDLFDIKRGIATGDNGFFVMPAERAAELGLPSEFLRPILPGTRHIADDEILADPDGYPRLDRRLVLLDCRADELTVQRDHPDLWRYLQGGKRGDVPVAERYL